MYLTGKIIEKILQVPVQFVTYQFVWMHRRNCIPEPQIGRANQAVLHLAEYLPRICLMAFEQKWMIEWYQP